MGTQSHSAVTGRDCVPCGGPCRQPFKLKPVPVNYPFMNADAIAATQPDETPQDPPRRPRRRQHRMAPFEHHDPAVEAS